MSVAFLHIYVYTLYPLSVATQQTIPNRAGLQQQCRSQFSELPGQLCNLESLTWQRSLEYYVGLRDCFIFWYNVPELWGQRGEDLSFQPLPLPRLPRALWSQVPEKARPEAQALPKPLLTSHLSVSHWPKQIRWRVSVRGDDTREAGTGVRAVGWQPPL